ncbi:MAG: hypothetical protein QRY72_00955 [Candidatus Rhabdochlamydia sp.]
MRIPLTILEKGDIYFFYWPHSESKGDHHLFFILRNQPEGIYRVITLQNGHMPDMKQHHIQKGRMTYTAKDLHQLEMHFEKQSKNALFEIANSMGEGKYLILKWGKSTHLLYSLEELAKQPEGVLDHLGIVSEGIFMLQIKNPNYDENSLDRLHLQQFIPLDSAEFLNEVGTEILMIGEKSQPKQIGQINLQTLLDSFSHEDILENVNLEQRQKELEILLTQDWS